MEPNRLKTVFLMCLVAVFAASLAWAGPSKQIIASVPHDFMVGEETLPAGKYIVERDNTYPPMITVRNDKGEGSSILHVITTLSRHGMEERDAKLVFDKTTGTVELSEVWFAGQDGYLVCGTVAAHTHDVVNAE